MPAIEIRGLVKRYGPVTAIDDLGFDVEHGEVTGFIGPNGAGKTTTLRVLLGLTRPDAGSATFGGARYRDLARPLEHVGALLEPLGFHPARSGRDHLTWLASTIGAGPSRVQEVLDLLELDDDAADRGAGGYSLGMRQRLGLAQAMLGDPGVLVLDEPANGLDPAGIRWLRTFLRKLARDGRAVLVSSHMLAELAQSIDSAVIIARGRLITEGRLAELTGSSERVRIETSQAAELAERLRTSGLTVETIDGAVLASGSPEQVGAIAYATGIPIHSLGPAAASLEEVFLGLTSSPEDEERVGAAV